MGLDNDLAEQMKAAMKNKDKATLEALRGIKSAIMLAKTDKGKDATLTEEEELKILQRLKKQRQESMELYDQQGRQDLAEEERLQLHVIETFLPQPLTSEELEAELRSIIEEVGASGPSDMGKVMGVASKRLAGRADGKEMSMKVKSLLA
ncbi:MAG: GatB/YqeY domain-containing protein [Bacteroidota bacterium]|nr:GatB/YqeY domain-containing protein [Bacteroidota bacterium]MDX5426763.1 GatB/YqeY domain-containing protein [Bacteroidota bacterium]MDX5504753.1 GatB/YqeY domain-containing protein [Bacteroidota bacterium]